MTMQYDIPKYIIHAKMSNKKRILVEGKDDREHIQNLISKLEIEEKIRIDTAENIRADDERTAKNNRAKIESIHTQCKGNQELESKLFFLCDREYLKFELNNQIDDLMTEHERDGNLSWTIGHSLENYFLSEEIICSAFRYLAGSGFKTEAIEILKLVLKDAVKLVAVATLAARDLQKSSYPAGAIRWQDFRIVNNVLIFEQEEWKKSQNNEIADRFANLLDRYKVIIDASPEEACIRISRGHTAIILIQRVFAACLYFAGLNSSSERAALREAQQFCTHKEASITTALCEAWLNYIEPGASSNYPVNLITALKES